MFAKGPRFPPEKPSEVPGPGHYNIPEDLRSESYKKGAFLEKADRFCVEKGSDVPGPGTYSTAPRDSNPKLGPSKPAPPSHGLTHLQQEIEALKSYVAKLQKEHQETTRKYEDKITHNESTIKSLVKDNVALQSQLSTQQKDHRLVCQRELALRAALEKADSAYKSQADHVRKVSALQRRAEDAEKSHVEDNRKFQSEIGRLKAELDGSRNTLAEQKEQSSILRKQAEATELRMQELKKAIIEDQSEIKRLRANLRDVEQAKTQARQTETRHKAELVDRETKFDQQTNILTTERRRREALEFQLNETKTQADSLTKEAQVRYRTLEDNLQRFRVLADKSDSAAADVATRLENLQTVMTMVAQAYEHLASSSVSRATHRQLQLQYTSLQLRSFRLERRLADREAMAEQLTDYCRQATEEKIVLAALLSDAEKDIETLSRGGVFSDDIWPDDTSLIYNALDVGQDVYQLRNSIAQSDLSHARALASLYQLEFEDVLVAYALADQEGIEQGAVTARLLNVCSGCQAEIDALRLAYSTAEASMSKQSIEIVEGVARERVLDNQLVGHKRKNAKLEGALKKERDVNARLVHAASQNKNNEEVLRLEIDKLAEELQDVTRYKEAHADLLAEVVELIQRNELAEEEADRLSRFNAEILGHTNPQQKIFYVDRIRRELAETKLQLQKSTRSREDLMADNVALQHEVAAYKSITVSDEYKPRNDRIRIERIPLTTRNMNEFTSDINFELTPPDEEHIDTLPMTLDEIM